MAALVCPNGHPLDSKQVKGSFFLPRKTCSICNARLPQGDTRYSCKICHHHLCARCTGETIQQQESDARHKAEIAEHSAHHLTLGEEVEEALAQRQELRLEEEATERTWPEMEAAVPEATERFLACRQELEAREEAWAESRRRARAGEAADELERLEGELAEFEAQARWYQDQSEMAGDASADAGVSPKSIQRQCRPLLAEQGKLQEEMDQWRKEAAALEAERPKLEAAEAEAQQRATQDLHDVARLRAELKDLLADADDIDDAISPGGGSPQSPSRRVVSAANENDARQLEAEVRASALRVSTLEQSLEKACERRQQDIAKTEARARYLENLKVARADAFANDVTNKSSEQVAALAVGMRADHALDGPPSPISRSSVRRRIEESPRPRPSLWGSPVSPGSRHSPRADTAAYTPHHDGPACAASSLVVENAQLRADVEALYAALQQAGNGQALETSSCHGSTLDVEPQLEPALNHSRTRLRTMLRQQLEDSRELMATLHRDIAEAEQGLLQERRGREKCAQRLQLAEEAASRGAVIVTPTKFRSAGANPSPMPQPPSMPPGERSPGGVSALGAISDAEDSNLNSSSSVSPMSYGGADWL